ncbi:MAG: tRNA(Ile2)-agmatinylcytidine synthase [Archaeoglobi archaeon]|nr:tRNA(Ile2)-agmatinylcytidine synthase [Archaeoglobi archaeon]
MGMWIGIDDTDSRRGMCTTYLLAELMEELSKFKIASLPRLIRLNPNIPFKTRGNGAVSIEILEWEEECREIVVNAIEERAMMEDDATHPGVVFIESPENYRELYHRALHEVLSVEEVVRALEKNGDEFAGWKKKRGVIGAAAAVGAELHDYTFELLAYRFPERWGTERCVDEESVFRANELTFPHTWDNVDEDERRIVIAPNSPDPVLFGIRGDSPAHIFLAYQTIRSEEVYKEVLFLTNQGTDAHIERKMPEREFGSYAFTGEVTSDPWEISGGHVFIEVSGIKCAAFEPTKKFRNVIRKLRKGDVVEVYGGYKKGTLNLEKMRIIKLREFEEVNPVCEKCGRRMESAGAGKGFRCRKCGEKKMERELVRVEREISPGFYEVPPSARRHLAMPLARILRREVSEQEASRSP